MFPDYVLLFYTFIICLREITMKKRECFNALMNQSTDWILKSAENPNQFMSKTIILLHYLALRKKGF